MDKEFLCQICEQAPWDALIMPCCSATICSAHLCQTCGVWGEPQGEVEPQPNYLFQAIIEDPASCQRCEEDAPKFFCKQCDVMLCTTWNREIHSRGQYRSHLVTQISQPSSRISANCDKHDLPVEYFWSEDWVALCEDCLVDHNKHLVLPLDELINETIFEIQSKQTKIDTKTNAIKGTQDGIKETVARIEAEAEKAKEQIAQHFKLLKNQLSAKETEFCHDIDFLKQKKVSTASKNLENISKEVQRCGNIQCLLKAITKIPGNIILENLKFISGKIDQVLLTEIADKVEVGSIGVHLDISALRNCISNLSLDKDDCMATPRQVRKKPLTTSQVHNSNAKSPRFTTKKLAQQGSERKISSRASMSDLKYNAARQGAISPRTISPNITPRIEDPMFIRQFTRKNCTSSSIQVSWSHASAPNPNLQYILEYGVGTTVNKVEQFRCVYKGTAHHCIITDLLPKTAYRFRVSPVLLCDEDRREWSDVITITTYDTQAIDMGSATLTKDAESWVTFEKPGIASCTYPYTFGKQIWETLLQPGADQDARSSIKVGIIGGKKSSHVIGTMIPSNAIKGIVRIVCCLDVESRSLTIYSPFNMSGEKFAHLSEGPFSPAVQNKSSKVNAIQFQMGFDQREDNIS